MTDVKAELVAMEKILRERGYSVADILRDTNVPASSWQRWKKGQQRPLITSWEKIRAAYFRRVGELTKT